MDQKNALSIGKSKCMIECPREKDIFYYRQACEQIIRPAGIRKWCLDCRHFIKDDPEVAGPGSDQQRNGGESC